MVGGVKRFKPEVQRMRFVNSDIPRERQIRLRGTWPEERVSAHITRPKAQLGADDIDRGNVPELGSRPTGWNRADSSRIGLVAQSIESSGVAELRDIHRRAIGEGDNAAELPSTHDLRQHAVISQELSRSKR